MHYPYSATIPNIIIDTFKCDTSSSNIIKKVCFYNGIHVDEIYSRSRKSNIVTSRQEAMYLIKTMNPKLPLKYIGQNIFHQYDHTTVIHSINHVSAQMRIYDDYNDKILSIIESL